MTYNNHKGKVLCTNWIRAIKNKEILVLNYLLSGSTDTTVGIWQYNKNADTDFCLKKLCTLNGHTDSITSISSLYIEGRNTYVIATCSADSSLKIWSGLELTSLELIQNIDLKNGFVFDVALHCLPYCKVPVLACASDDFKVKLYVAKSMSKGMYFENVLQLKGHEDWVRGVDFITVDSDNLYLASCSQDSFIRLWKITCGDEPEPGELKLKKHFFSVDQWFSTLSVPWPIFQPKLTSQPTLVNKIKFPPQNHSVL